MDGAADDVDDCPLSMRKRVVDVISGRGGVSAADRAVDVVMVELRLFISSSEDVLVGQKSFLTDTGHDGQQEQSSSS
jgi:hypothetical protein